MVVKLALLNGPARLCTKVPITGRLLQNSDTTGFSDCVKTQLLILPNIYVVSGTTDEIATISMVSFCASFQAILSAFINGIGSR